MWSTFINNWIEFFFTCLKYYIITQYQLVKCFGIPTHKKAFNPCVRYRWSELPHGMYLKDAHINNWDCTYLNQTKVFSYVKLDWLKTNHRPITVLLYLKNYDLNHNATINDNIDWIMKLMYKKLWNWIRFLNHALK